jgi:hypothetical protein
MTGTKDIAINASITSSSSYLLNVVLILQSIQWFYHTTHKGKLLPVISIFLINSKLFLSCKYPGVHIHNSTEQVLESPSTDHHYPKVINSITNKRKIKEEIKIKKINPFQMR